MRRTLVAISLVAATVAVPGSSSASPLELFGFGGRAPGLAGSGVADAEGFGSVYLNPAGLAQVKRKRLTLGTAAAGFRLDVDARRSRVDRSTAFVFGGAVPIPFGGVLSERVVLGIGFHVPNKALVRVDRPVVGDPTFVLLDNRADSVAAQVAVGFRVNDKLSVGAGVLILAALAGKITVTNDAAGAFVTQSNQTLETDIAPIVGARYQLDSRLALGLTARGPSRSDYKIEVETELTSIPLGLPELAVAGNAQYDPGMVALGGAYTLRPDVLVLADLEYRRWSQFPRPTENPVVANPPPPSPGFSDTVVPRIAVEIERPIASVRARGRVGYAFFLSPAPEMTGEATLLDNNRHMLALGLGVSFTAGSVPFQLDAWTQVHQLQGRDHDKQDSDVTISSGGRLAAGGLTLGVDL